MWKRADQGVEQMLDAIKPHTALMFNSSEQDKQNQDQC